MTQAQGDKGKPYQPEERKHLLKGNSARKSSPSEGIMRVLNTWAASLLATGMSLPILASAATVALYLSGPFPFIPIPTPNWYAPVFGIVIALIVWFFLGIVFYRFATPQGQNMRSYSLLEIRLRQLKARLGITEPYTKYKEMSNQEMEQLLECMKKAIEFTLDEGADEVALREAFSYSNDLQEMLYGSSANLSWAFGVGYINAWSLLHRAEEALIMAEPTSIVIGETIHDMLAIEGSTIANRDELLDKLLQAVKDLDLTAMVYFSEHQPDKNYAELAQAIRQHDRILTQLVQAFNKANPSAMIEVHSDSEATTTLSSEELKKRKSRARATLREVRRALNEFRDNSWEGIVRARTNLIGMIALTGFVTHILLCIAILINPSPLKGPAIIAATAFYMVGAIAGMFGRFYKESGNSTAVDDYGLTAARAIATPLLSGLAGVGGVLITILLYSTLPGVSVTIPIKNLSAIFQLDQPLYFIAAAVFGLTPNLIIKSLQQRADKYMNNLSSSKTTGQEGGAGLE